ncbi:MAG TPA: DegV family protein [Acidimicrobiales bacterium]|nr:DegV family protein [Acidimicrobiales bacterium]
MGAVRIVTDSACDLTPELAERHGITVVPLTIRFGDEELLDRRDLSPSEFWRRCKAAAELPGTAAPAPGAFREAYESVAEEGGGGVLCLTISSGVSATYQSALAAADGFSTVPIRVIDTRSVSMGQGLLALAASEAAVGGATLDELVTQTEERMTRTRVFGVLDSLDHLQRGGRIGGARALLGSILSIKPVIQVENGVVEQESRQRTRSRSLRYLADKVLADAPLERLAVANGAAEDVGSLLSMLDGVAVEHATVVVDLGPVVGTHAGPGTIGVCYQVAAIPDLSGD